MNASSDPELEPLLTAEEVAPILRVRPATVYEAAANGRIPCVRLWEGRKRGLVRFRRSDIENLIRQRSVGTGEVAK